MLFLNTRAERLHRLKTRIDFYLEIPVDYSQIAISNLKIREGTVCGGQPLLLSASPSGTEKETKMTEPVKQDGELNNQQTPVAAVNEKTPSVNSTTVEEEAWWNEASKEHGFKSKEDVYKSWTEANKKISEQGEALKNAELFQTNVVPVLDIVLADEEIMGKVKAKMEGKTPEKAAPINNQAPPEDTDTKKYLLDNIVNSFEESHGISKLDPDTQKEVKAKIGIELKKFTTEKETKLNLLPKQLEDAFKLALSNDDKLKEIFAAKEDSLSDYGSIPSQASGLDKDGNIKLTPEQEKVAERMPGGREAYIKGLKKLQVK